MSCWEKRNTFYEVYLPMTASSTVIALRKVFFDHFQTLLSLYYKDLVGNKILNILNFPTL